MAGFGADRGVWVWMEGGRMSVAACELDADSEHRAACICCTISLSLSPSPATQAPSRTPPPTLLPQRVTQQPCTPQLRTQ